VNELALENKSIKKNLENKITHGSGSWTAAMLMKMVAVARRSWCGC
jgi:hypothetical protein